MLCPACPWQLNGLRLIPPIIAATLPPTQRHWFPTSTLHDGSFCFSFVPRKMPRNNITVGRGRKKQLWDSHFWLSDLSPNAKTKRRSNPLQAGRQQLLGERHRLFSVRGVTQLAAPETPRTPPFPPHFPHTFL